MDNNFEYLTIEESNVGFGVAVKGYRTCKDGVLEGQMVSHFIDSFDTYGDAAMEYPEARVGSVNPEHSFHHLPDDGEPPVGNRPMKPDGRY